VLTEELAGIEKQLVQMNTTIAGLEKTVKACQALVTECNDKYENAKAELDQQRSILLATDSQLAALQKQRERDSKALVDTKLQVQRSEHKISRFESDQRESAQTIKSLLANHKWIETEKQYVVSPSPVVQLDGSLKEKTDSLAHAGYLELLAASTISRRSISTESRRISPRSRRHRRCSPSRSTARS